jgi:hypothetical protein
MKVMKLASDWNQLLKPHEGPMTGAQQEMIDKMKGMPGGGCPCCSNPGGRAYRLSDDERDQIQTHGAAGTADAIENSGTSTIVLPIDATKSITLERIRYSSDARGCTWHGIVTETGESALLMRWNDGHITGLVGYKGRIFTVASLGEQLHAMVEMDPRKMPPPTMLPTGQLLIRARICAPMRRPRLLRL